MSVGNFHPISFYLPCVFKSVAWVTFQLADCRVVSWSLYGTLALTCHLWFNTFSIKRERSALLPCEVGTSDCNHVSNYNANGAAAIFSAAPPTFNISGGKGRRSPSHSNKRLQSIPAKWNKSNSYRRRWAGRRETFHHIPLASSRFPVTQFQLITAHRRLWQWVTSALHSAWFIRGQGEMFCRWRLEVWVTLRQLRLLERDTLTEDMRGEKADLLPWKPLCRSFKLHYFDSTAI